MLTNRQFSHRHLFFINVSYQHTSQYHTFNTTHLTNRTLTTLILVLHSNTCQQQIYWQHTFSMAFSNFAFAKEIYLVTFKNYKRKFYQPSVTSTKFLNWRTIQLKDERKTVLFSTLKPQFTLFTTDRESRAYSDGRYSFHSLKCIPITDFFLLLCTIYLPFHELLDGSKNIISSRDDLFLGVNCARKTQLSLTAHEKE